MEVLLPGSPEYELARRPAIANFHDTRPQAVVRCASAEDVVEAIAMARREGLPVAARSGGHCFAGRSSTEGIVIDVRPMRSVAVADATATVGAGARLGEVYDTLLEHGLTLAAGCGPEVRTAGLVLGGGLGLLGRSHGLTCDQLLGAQVVLPDGRIVDCDADRHEDLFWALRGAGGGNFGIATRFVLRALPAPDATRFHLVWPAEHAAAVLGAWQATAPAAPDALAASLLITAAADLERPPRVNVFGAMLGSERDATEQLGELVARAGADPDSAAFEHASYRATKRSLAEHGPGEERPGAHGYNKSEFFRGQLPNDAIAALVEHFAGARVAGQSRELDFTPWGGAYNRVPAGATAFPHRDARFLLKHAAVVDGGASTAERDAARAWLARSWELVHPWGSGGVYVNFPDPELEDPGRAYHAGNYERLMRVKARYDPGELLRFPQSIPAQGS
jgi:FAD/FMN-containing dehydrogenase